MEKVSMFVKLLFLEDRNKFRNYVLVGRKISRVFRNNVKWGNWKVFVSSINLKVLICFEFFFWSWDKKNIFFFLEMEFGIFIMLGVVFILVIVLGNCGFFLVWVWINLEEKVNLRCVFKFMFVRGSLFMWLLLMSLVKF